MRPRATHPNISEIARAVDPINRTRMPLNALRAFEAVATHGGFTPAGAALLISQGTLSRHVINLEGLLGVPLFDRKAHATILTREGEALLEVVRGSLDTLQQELNSLCRKGKHQRPVLRIQMPRSLAIELATPVLRAFCQTHGQLDIEVVSAAEAGEPLVEKEVDIAIVCKTFAPSDASADVSWPARLGIVCHPSILAACRAYDIRSFVAANEMVHHRLGELPRRHLWSQFLRHLGLDALTANRGLVFDTASLAVQYARSGQAIALLDTTLFSAALASGQLVQPFNVTWDQAYCYCLVMGSGGATNGAASAFRRQLLEYLAYKGIIDRQPAPWVHANPTVVGPRLRA